MQIKLTTFRCWFFAFLSCWIFSSPYFRVFLRLGFFRKPKRSCYFCLILLTIHGHICTTTATHIRTSPCRYRNTVYVLMIHTQWWEVAQAMLTLSSNRRKKKRSIQQQKSKRNPFRFKRKNICFVWCLFINNNIVKFIACCEQILTGTDWLSVLISHICSEFFVTICERVWFLVTLHWNIFKCMYCIDRPLHSHTNTNTHER